MKADKRMEAGRFITAVVLAACVLPSARAEQATQPAAAESALPAATDAKAEPGISNVGIIKGNDVYVRSGFHQNYYPVTKLNKGDKITVLGEEYGWLKIEPPAGAYSLVEKVLIDKIDEQTGEANGEVTVYAGSNLNDRRYAKQVKLDKGARVQLIGETSDGGFYKIQPPAGAALWIKADLVDRGGRGESEPKIEKVKPGELALSGAGMPATRPADAAKAGPPDKITPQVEAKQTQMDINAIEALISAEATKPLNERSYEPIIAKLKPLAEQAGDPVGKTYAETRIRQLQEEIQLAQAVRQIREMKEKAIMDADQIAQERMKIKAEPGAPMDDIAIRGEVQVSGLYDGSAGRPKRWRVVSPGERRTLAYIEVPESSPIDPVLFYGKYVGIRASTRRMTENTTPPLPLLTVQEIVVLDPLARKAAFASENPPAVPVSENESSQPATEMTPAEPAPAASTQPAAAENN